ncbi:MAG: Peptidase family M23 [Algoriphagus marincola HL-49]|uniref:Peptidase family M23 n=1 Tax=Algoriphagus marincola HL-49 TaxID=1305737 RepID=A0A0P7YE68_9BACT|nr:MAG: Peptidase family M23 [Algoriphagus marincola HL-49]
MSILQSFKFSTILLVFFSAGLLQAQVQIVADQDMEKNLTLIAYNTSEIPYTIQIEFVSLENLKSLEGDLIFKVARPGKTNLVTLQSIYINEKTSFNYRTQLFKGEYLPNTTSDFPYLVPFEKAVTFSMRRIIPKANPTIPVENLPYTGVLFFTDSSTQICAPRKGIVSEMRMDQSSASEEIADFESENFIEIYHQDGTFSRLSGLKENSAKVSIGEMVIPGQIIAELSDPTNGSEYQIKMIQSRWDFNENGMQWINFPVQLETANAQLKSDETADDLTSTHSEELIIKEMDKKELKKYKKN